MVTEAMKLKDAPWQKSYDQPRQRIKKQRRYFTNKCPSSQSYDFSSSHVWIRELDYEESWVPKNWCFWTVMLEKTLESPLDCKEISQSIRKEISLEYSLEGLMLKLKFQYFGPLMRRTDSLEQTILFSCWERLKAGEWVGTGWGGWMASLTQWMRVLVNSRSWWWTGRPGMLQSMGSQSQTRLRDWTELNWTASHLFILHCNSGHFYGSDFYFSSL